MEYMSLRAQRRGNFFELFLNFRPEIPDDEGDFFYFPVVKVHDVFAGALDDRLTGDGDQGFGNGKGMGAKSGSAPGHWNDDFHEKGFGIG